MSVRRRAREARRELAVIRHAPPAGEGAEGSPPALAWWYRWHTPEICDFLESLPDGELLGWPDLFTALHELTGSAYACWALDPTLSPREAWDALDLRHHLAVVRCLSHGRREADPRSFAPLWERYVAFLGRRGKLGEDQVARFRAKVARLGVAPPRARAS